MQPIPQNELAAITLLTVKQVQTALNVCERTVYGLFERGDLRQVKLGESTRIPYLDVQALIERGVREAA
jgi:excisionase family DNA binding protein